MMDNKWKIAHKRSNTHIVNKHMAWWPHFGLSVMTSRIHRQGKELISSWANVALNRSSDFSHWNLRKLSYGRSLNSIYSLGTLNPENNGTSYSHGGLPDCCHSSSIARSLFHAHPNIADFFLSQILFCFVCGCLQWCSFTFKKVEIMWTVEQRTDVETLCFLSFYWLFHSPRTRELAGL